MYKKEYKKVSRRQCIKKSIKKSQEAVSRQFREDSSEHSKNAVDLISENVYFVCNETQTYWCSCWKFN